MAQKNEDKIYEDFKNAVNMTPAALEKWLNSEESLKVGWKGDDGKGDGESVGHQSGKQIVQRKRKSELNAADYRHMAKVVGYVKRHMAQGPEKNVEQSRWRYSLMNWGHDPLKK
jgi:Protein of unknown function (DUF3140)